MNYLEIYDEAGGRGVPVGNYYTLGRSAANHIRLYGETVSRRHARIVLHGDGVVLEDLGSTFGTVVNGRYVSQWYVLKNGDHIQLGEARIIYRQVQSAGKHEAITPPRIPPQVSSSGPAIPPNMIRCPHCGTPNLKSNSVCYNCGGTLAMQQRISAPGAGRAVAVTSTALPGGSVTGRAVVTPAPSWLTTLLVIVMTVLMGLLSLLLGLMLMGMRPGA